MMARWLSSRCRRCRLRERTNAKGEPWPSIASVERRETEMLSTQARPKTAGAARGIGALVSRGSRRRPRMGKRCRQATARQAWQPCLWLAVLPLRPLLVSPWFRWSCGATRRRAWQSCLRLAVLPNRPWLGKFRRRARPRRTWQPCHPLAALPNPRHRRQRLLSLTRGEKAVFVAKGKPWNGRCGSAKTGRTKESLLFLACTY
jgi:hypothetical protein